MIIHYDQCINNTYPVVYFTFLSTSNTESPLFFVICLTKLTQSLNFKFISIISYLPNKKMNQTKAD